MLLFYINFGDRNPPYPALGSNIPSARRRGQRFHFLQCRGSSPSFRFGNRRGGGGGQGGCLHQDIFTRKVTDIAFTSDFCNNYSHSASPASLYLTSPRPRVPYLMSSSPSSCISKSQVLTHASRSPRPLVPVPLLYTAGSHSLNMHFLKKEWSKYSFCFQVTYVIQADPKGWIPKWAVNMFAWQQALNVARIRKIIEVCSSLNFIFWWP